MNDYYMNDLWICKGKRRPLGSIHQSYIQFHQSIIIIIINELEIID